LQLKSSSVGNGRLASSAHSSVSEHFLPLQAALYVTI